MAQLSKISEEEIIALMQRDARRAIEYILSQYGGALLWTIKKMVNSEELAEDLLQDAFVKIWRNAKQYDPNKGKLFTWLVQVTRNVVLDKVRTQKFQARQKSENLETTVTNDISYSEEMELSDPGLARLISRLDPKYQEIIELAYFQGYSQSEIAKRLDIPLGTVKTRVKIALRELRAALQNKNVGAALLISLEIALELMILID